MAARIRFAARRYTYDYEAGVDIYDATDGAIETVIYQLSIYQVLGTWAYTIQLHGHQISYEGGYETEQDAREDAQEECEAFVRAALEDHGDPRHEHDYYL